MVNTNQDSGMFITDAILVMLADGENEPRFGRCIRGSRYKVTYIGNGCFPLLADTRKLNIYIYMYICIPIFMYMYIHWIFIKFITASTNYCLFTFYVFLLGPGLPAVCSRYQGQHGPTATFPLELATYFMELATHSFDL